MDKHHHQTGFTLLEVLVALAIVGIALGTLMSLSAANKQLAFRASNSMEQTFYLRAAMNFAQIVEEPDDYPEYPQLIADSFDLDIEDELEPSERQTQKMRIALQPYTLIDTETGVELKSMRWLQLETPQ